MEPWEQLSLLGGNVTVIIVDLIFNFINETKNIVRSSHMFRIIVNQ